MATLSQRSNGTYYTQFYKADRTPPKKRVYLGTKSPTVAEAYHTLVVKDYEDGFFDPWKEKWSETLRAEKLAAVHEYQQAKRELRPITLLEGSRTYLAEKALEIRGTTLANYTVVVEMFVEHAGAGTLTTELTPEVLRRFLTRRGLSVVTQNTYKDCLKTFFRWCVEREHMAEDLSSLVKLRRPPRKFPRFLMPDEVNHLVEIIRKDNEPRKHWRRGNHLWLLPIIRSMVYCGLRQEEFINLRWHWVNFELEKLTVFQGEGAFQTKSGEERTITVADEAIKVLKELRCQRGTVKPGDYVFQDYRGKLTGDHVTKTFAHYRDLAGLKPDITVHSLRHTALSWLAMAGVDVESIRVFAGHADIDTKMRYMHVAPEYHHAKIKGAFQRWDQ